MFNLIIVEDEHLIRKWLEIAVDYSALGIQVVGTASHGQEGMELIQKLKPHIVLTDITMPIMDAFMMFEATKSLSYEKVILSGYDDFQNAKKAMQFGAVDFLSKPINVTELTECLEKITLRLQMNQHQNNPFLQDYQTFVTALQKITETNHFIRTERHKSASKNQSSKPTNPANSRICTPTLFRTLYYFHHCRKSRL